MSKAASLVPEGWRGGVVALLATAYYSGIITWGGVAIAVVLVWFALFERKWHQPNDESEPDAHGG